MLPFATRDFKYHRAFMVGTNSDSIQRVFVLHTDSERIARKCRFDAPGRVR